MHDGELNRQVLSSGCDLECVQVDPELFQVGPDREFLVKALGIFGHVPQKLEKGLRFISIISAVLYNDFFLIAVAIGEMEHHERLHLELLHKGQIFFRVNVN